MCVSMCVNPYIHPYIYLNPYISGISDAVRCHNKDRPFYVVTLFF